MKNMFLSLSMKSLSWSQHNVQYVYVRVCSWCRRSRDACWVVRRWTIWTSSWLRGFYRSSWIIIRRSCRCPCTYAMPWKITSAIWNHWWVFTTVYLFIKVDLQCLFSFFIHLTLIYMHSWSQTTCPGSGVAMPTYSFCRQISPREFEEQKLSVSQAALADLLENLIKDKNMSVKEKKKKLKMVFFFYF